MLPTEQNNFCFCTFAGGDVYRALAKNLASDLKKFSPGTPLVLFTDRAQDFAEFDNVIAVQHRRQGVKFYHERRFAIAKALSMFESCIYLDADVRICAPVPSNLSWKPGITARSCAAMMKHIQERMYQGDAPRPEWVKNFKLYQTMAHKLGLDITLNEMTWVNEFLFVVTRDSGRELEWLDLWGKLAQYAEVQGMHKHPAYAMGIAAAKVGFPIQHDLMEGIDFFDDRIERCRISKGESDPEAKRQYFQVQGSIEYPDRSLLDRATRKIHRNVDYFWNLARLKVKALFEDFRFYYR